MPMLETLAIDEIISQHELDVRKGLYKGHAPALAKGTRFLATNLRRRMNALAQQDASSRTPTPSAVPATAVSEEARTPSVEVAGTPLVDEALVPAPAPES